MPTFAANMRHSPESYPLFNDEVKNKFKGVVSEREDVAKRLEVKLLSTYTSVLDHLIFYVVEAPSQPAVEDYFKEIGFAFWNTVEIRQVQLVEEVSKKL